MVVLTFGKCDGSGGGFVLYLFIEDENQCKTHSQIDYVKAISGYPWKILTYQNPS